MRHQGTIWMAAVASMLMVSSALAGDPAGGRFLTERIADELIAGGNANIAEMIAAETGQADLVAARAEQGVAGPEGIRDEADPPRDDRQIERRMIERRKEELRQGQQREEARRPEAREGAQREEARRPEAREGAQREEARRPEVRVTVHAERVNEGSEEARRLEAREGAQREIQLLETKLREIQERLTELRRGARGEAQRPEAQKLQPRQDYEPLGIQRGQTQGPMMGRGQGQGPMMGRGQGQGPIMGRGRGQGQGPMMGQGRGWGSMMQSRTPWARPQAGPTPSCPMCRARGGICPMCQMRLGQGQGPMMGRGQGQGPMMGRVQGQGPMMGRGQGQGPMMQGRRTEAMPEGRLQQRREAMPEQGRRKRPMPEGPEAKAITPSFKVPLAGRAVRLLEPGVAEKLRLSDEQRDRIHRLLAEYGEQIARMSERVVNAIRDIPAGERAGKAAEIVGNAKKHAYDLASKLVDKATDVLTPRQRAAIEKLFDGMDKMGKAPKSREKEDGDGNDGDR